MALTYSSMLDLGTEIVPFKLLNVLTNENFSSNNLDHNKSSLIMFICNHCPYVIHYHEQIKILASEYADAINLVAISSNDVVNYPEDSPEKMNQLWSRLGLKFPYLFDESQEIAKKFGAVCTPDFFGYNKDLKLQYRGRFRELKEMIPVKHGESDLKSAMKLVSRTQNGPKEQIPSMGCNIKWIK